MKFLNFSEFSRNEVMETVPVTMITILDALRINIITTFTTHKFTVSSKVFTAAVILCADTIIIISDGKFHHRTLKIAWRIKYESNCMTRLFTTGRVLSKVDGHGWTWTVLTTKGSKRVKLDGPKIQKWTLNF